MNFVSTRDRNGRRYSLTEAILSGLAPDGGLFVPESIPALSPDFTLSKGYAYAAYTALKPFFEGDEAEGDLLEICQKAFDFPISLRENGGRDTLELFYGPTSAFKDFGARFLAFFLEKALERRGQDVTILVATSGDTGGAVASAFYGRKHIKVKVLYPRGRVAERQRRQLTCWDGNIESYEVDGSFDDCQRMVKEAFVDRSLSGLTSANSINLGRLLPQAAYYVFASHLYEAKYSVKPTFIIPSGNVGNSTGAYWAKAMGCPIERIVLSVNANRTIPDYLESGVYEKRPSVQTLANAMDVGAPSNMERLFDLFGTYEEMKKNVSAYSVSDDIIRKTIVDVYKEQGYILCPHTATGEYVRRTYLPSEATIVVSTAHPAKFESIVEPLIGRQIPIPRNLFEMIEKESRFRSIEADYHKLFEN